MGMVGETSRRTTSGARTRRVTTLLVGVALALSACGSMSSEDSATTASDDAGEFDADVEVEEAAPDEPDAAVDDSADTGDTSAEPGSSDTIATPAATGRRVIRTAQLVLEVDEPAAAAQEVFAIAERRGGFVAETDLERDVEGAVFGTITLRVPSAQLIDAVEELDRLAASVPVRRIDETDVTSETADLDARIRNLTTYERELSELLADVRATTDRPDDLLTVFERIRSVREEIDRLEARLAVLSDQVALSTISVTLSSTPAAVTIADTTWNPGGQVREALATTSRALTGIADAGIWIVLTALPVLLVLGSPFLIAALVWRRRTANAGDA